MPDLAYSVFRPTGRAKFYVEWTDPRTNRRIRKTTAKTVERDAQRVARRIIDEWEVERSRAGNEGWVRFREAYAEEVLPSLAKETQRLYGTVFNAIEKHLNPATLADVTSRELSRLQAIWRRQPLEEATIRTYLAHLGKALQWAHRQGFLSDLPHIERSQLAAKQKKAKGRPINAEEFDRMIAAVPKVIRDAAAEPSWVRLLRGLWLSGLRLDEALHLSWDDPTSIRVDLDGGFPALIIPAAREKGRKDRVIPIVADFAEMLQQTPAEDRHGRVFRLVGRRKAEPSGMQFVSATISKIGRQAGVIVGQYTRKGKTKYASAHDLRRSFGKRWAGLVRNAFDLKLLMRHADIRTTEQFYAHEDARDLAAELSRRHADTLAISGSDSHPEASAKSSEK
jgi:integrase